jgi:hypothetical protein
MNKKKSTKLKKNKGWKELKNTEVVGAFFVFF